MPDKPMPATLRGIIVERFMSRVAEQYPASGCWIWIGAKSGLPGQPYGLFGIAGKVIYAHRASHELFIGEIPPGHSIDHLCRVPLCVNPDHLEAVLPQVNTLRSNSASALNARKTHCSRDHAFDPPNTYLRPDGGGRGCLACAKLRKRNRVAERRRAAGVTQLSGRILVQECPRGHALAEPNVYVYPNGKRSCRECARKSSRDYMRRTRARQRGGVAA